MQHPENLLIFSAGNDGDIGDGRNVCTMGSPAIAKNVLAIGSTSSGETRFTSTGSDGNVFNASSKWSDIDTVSFFSSFGPTQDNRIKPELVAPGDLVRPSGYPLSPTDVMLHGRWHHGINTSIYASNYLYCGVEIIHL